MTSPALEGHGTTIGFGTSTVTFNVIDMQLPDKTRAAIETTHLGTSNARTHMPETLYDGGEFSMTVEYDKADLYELPSNAEETVTITFPLEAGDSTSTTVVFTGFCTSESGPSVTTGERMTGSITIKVDGEITVTPGAP